MRIIDADKLKSSVRDAAPINMDSVYALIDNQPTVPTFREWHEIKTEGLPKEKGYYLVAFKRKKYSTNEIYYDTGLIFFRGKTAWATGGENIKAWMALPDDFKKLSE